MKAIAKALRIFLISILLFSCKKDVIEPDPLATYQNVILRTATKEPEKLQNVKEVKVESDQIILTFSNLTGIPEYKEGDVLLGKSGGGYLRKVVSVSKVGSILTIRTSEAALDEAFDEIHIDTSFTFIPTKQSIGQLNFQETLPIKGRDYIYTLKSSQAVFETNEATGELILTFPNISFKIETPDKTGKLEISAEELKIGIKTTLNKCAIEYQNLFHSKFVLIYKVDCFKEFNNVSMILKGGIDEQFPDFSNEDLLPMDILLGVLPVGPVQLTFRLNLAAGIRGKFLMGVGTNFYSSLESSTTYLVGAERIDGAWSIVWEKSASATNSSVNFSPVGTMEGEARLFFKPKFKVLLYDNMGPVFFVSGFAYTELKSPPISAAWGFGLNGGATLDLGILSKVIPNATFTLTEKKWPQWSYNNNYPNIPVVVNPINSSVNQQTSLTLQWTCSDPDGDGLVYDVYFGTAPNPSTLIGSNLPVSSIARSGLNPNTKYYWKVVAKDSKGAITIGPEWSFTTLLGSSKPSVTTSAVTEITPTSARIGGIVTNDGGSVVTERGIFWSINQNPELTGTRLQIGSGIGSFSTTLNNLSSNKTYYIRAYAINAQGTEYGTQIPFTTVDNSGTSTLKNSLISYWKFDEGYGNTAYDVLGINHGTITNAAWSTTGKIGNSLEFNGISSAVSVPHNSVYNTQTFTISFWAKSTSTSRQTPISKWWNNITRQWEVVFNDNKIIGNIGFFIGYSGGFKVVSYTTSQVYDGNWHLYTFTMNNGLIKIWIDGLEKASVNTGYTMLYNDRPINIGQDSYYGIPNFLPYKGTIDEPAIWGRVLSATEIQSLYNNALGVQYPF